MLLAMMATLIFYTGCVDEYNPGSNSGQYQADPLELAGTENHRTLNANVGALLAGVQTNTPTTSAATIPLDEKIPIAYGPFPELYTTGSLKQKADIASEILGFQKDTLEIALTLELSTRLPWFITLAT